MSALFQNAFYIGNNINTILYGVELVLYFSTMNKLLKNKQNRGRSDVVFMVFSTALLILITIYVATQAVFGEEMWIVNAGYPGGATAYNAAHASVWYQTMGTTAAVILNLLADGIMIYRCSVLWGDYRIIIIPCILYIATFALGIVSLYMTGAPSGDIWAGLAAHVTLAYSSTTIGLNVILTCLICGRILYFARQSQKDLGTQFLRTYISVASIIIESALPFTLSGIAYLVTFGLNNGLEILFLSIYGMFTCISPQLIIMRVVAGRAWNQHTFTVTAASGIFDSPSGLAVSHHPADTNEQAAISLQLQNLTKSDGSSMEIV